MPELRGASALVTGGAGFIGSHLVERLLERGARRVHVVDDLSLGREENLAGVRDSAGVALTVADCARLDSPMENGERFDFCFHLAVIPLPHSLLHPRENVERNVAMTTGVCELWRAGGYGRLVSLSSSEVYGTAQSTPMSEDHPLGAQTPYAAAKAACDLVVASYITTFGLEAVTVRPFNTYGERQNDAAFVALIPAVVQAVRTDKPVRIHGDGEQTRDMTYVGDTVAATMSLAASDAALGGTFNVGRGDHTSVNELVHRTLEILDRPSHPVEHVAPRPGDVQQLLADTRRLREVVGFEPATSLQQGLEATVSWYLEQSGRLARPASYFPRK